MAGANDLAGNDLAVIQLKLNGLAFVECQQILKRHRIGEVILFEDLQVDLAGRVAQDHRVRLRAGGETSVADAGDSGFEIEGDSVTHKCEVFGVNGEGRICCSEEQSGEQQAGGQTKS